MKCIINNEMLMEIIEDLSERLRVSDNELDCMKLYLADKNRSKRSIDEETNENELTTVAAEVSTDFSLYDDEATTMTSFDTVEDANEIKFNVIVKNNSSQEISNENEAAKSTNDEECKIYLQEVFKRITNYDYSLLNKEENRCVSNKITERDINNTIGFIILRQSNITDDQMNIRNERAKVLISTSIWNIMDCVDIFGFTDIVNNLLSK